MKQWPSYRLQRKIGQPVGLSGQQVGRILIHTSILAAVYAHARRDFRCNARVVSPYETPDAAERRVAAQEACWNLVWKRRIAYFATVAATLLFLWLPLREPEATPIEFNWNPLQRLIFSAGVPFRRVWTADWFVPIARVGRTGKQQYALNQTTQEITPRRSGELFLFVNDAIAPPWKWFYENNGGTATVKVTNVPDPDAPRASR